jgi:hypothetical protein
MVMGVEIADPASIHESRGTACCAQDVARGGKPNCKSAKHGEEEQRDGAVVEAIEQLLQADPPHSRGRTYRHHEREKAARSRTSAM